MKLKYIVEPLNAGGSAVPGCGTIHISEIKPTLDKLSDDLLFPFNLNDYVLGSTGKREYSGDIDLVLDYSQYNAGYKEFHKNLVNQFGLEVTARNAEMVHLKYPIKNYNILLQGYQPRTGFVQIDFNFGDEKWERFYHYSPGEESGYKGAHRNLAISALASVFKLSVSPILDFYDRPISLVKWKFGPKGLIKVKRQSIINPKNDKWSNKQTDTIIEGPYYNADRIAKILLPVDGIASDLNSLETIIAAVKRNFGMVDQERIWLRIAYNFTSWKYGKDFIYPTEISNYFLSNDK